MADDLFEKAIQNLRVLVHNNVCQKLSNLSARASVLSFSGPIFFDDSFSVISVSFSDADFHSFSCELKKFVFTLIYRVLYTNTKLNCHCVYNNLTAPCEKSKMIYFSSSRMKTIHTHSARSRFLVKLIWFYAFGSTSNACLLK